MIFEIIKTFSTYDQNQNEQDTTSFRSRLNLIYQKEQKGPVSAVGSVDGFLLVAVGPKVYV